MLTRTPGRWNPILIAAGAIAFCAVLAFWSVGMGWNVWALVSVAAGFLTATALIGYLPNLFAGFVQARSEATIAQIDAPDDVPDEAPQKTDTVADRRVIQQLFDSLPVPLLRIDRAGRVVQSNRASRDLLDLYPDEHVAFDDLVEGLGRSVNSWLSLAYDTARKPKAEMVMAKRSPGETVLRVSLMERAAGPGDSLLAVLSDASELRSLEAQFVQSQKMQAIGQLAGGVAHDFNNLLTAISGYCDLLLLRHESNDPDYGDLVQINQNANRAAALVGQLLAFSRKQTLQPQSVNLNDTLSELSHLLNRLLGEKVLLHFEYGKDLPPVFVDARQMEQVIMNLVVNARDAMPDGGEVQVISDKIVFEDDETVEKVLVPAGEYVSIEVRDTGRGIRSDRIDKIFEPFYTTKEMGEGTGLGLSMAYGIVKQTGGFIFAESQVDTGSTFRILLPAQTEAHAAEATGTKEDAAPTKPLNGLSVLLVEDEAPVRTFAARALKLHGIMVIEADSAEAALKVLSDPAVKVDIFVSDVVMPGMNGPTWVREALKDRPEVKVVFVSGYAEESFEREHAEIANSHFLPKPFSLKQLIDCVRQLADR